MPSIRMVMMKRIRWRLMWAIRSICLMKMSLQPLWMNCSTTFSIISLMTPDSRVSPLPYKEGHGEEKLTKQEWPHYDHFKNQELLAVIYEREHDYELSKDTSMRNVAVEWIGLKEDVVQNFRFNRLNGKWMLTQIDKHGRSEMPEGDFLNFYARFVADSVVQREALADPVKVILTSEDGEEAPEEDYVNPDEWFGMRESLPLPKDALVNVNYGQASISQNKKILLIQGLGNGMQMKFKFNKQDDNWKLTEIEY